MRCSARRGASATKISRPNLGRTPPDRAVCKALKPTWERSRTPPGFWQDAGVNAIPNPDATGPIPERALPARLRYHGRPDQPAWLEVVSRAPRERAMRATRARAMCWGVAVAAEIAWRCVACGRALAVIVDLSLLEAAAGAAGA
jgi:hypothetical protein